MIYDAAVVIPTVLRPVLGRALRSVFAQDLDGSVQVMVGIDRALGPRDRLESLRREAPERMTVEVVELGYSTAARHGGLYPVGAGGALRTILSYAANARHIAYLDDDNWWAADHLSSLLGAIEGFGWAFSHRWYVDPGSQEPLCVDEWESTGPGKGLYDKRARGFVDTNCLMLDKERCHWILPAWSTVVGEAGGVGEDRRVFDLLRRDQAVAWSGRATAYYVIHEADRPLVEKLMATRRDFSRPPEAACALGVLPDAL